MKNPPNFDQNSKTTSRILGTEFHKQSRATKPISKNTSQKPRKQSNKCHSDPRNASQCKQSVLLFKRVYTKKCDVELSVKRQDSNEQRESRLQEGDETASKNAQGFPQVLETTGNAPKKLQSNQTIRQSSTEECPEAQGRQIIKDKANENPWREKSLEQVKQTVTLPELLRGHAFAKEIQALTALHCRDFAVMQLQYAIYGYGSQCPQCLKFLNDKYFCEHQAECAQSQYRIQFAKLLNGNYFCLLGCAQFTTRRDLVDHLLNFHVDDQELLRPWGISLRHLCLQTRGGRAAQYPLSSSQSKQVEVETLAKLSLSLNPLLKSVIESVDREPFIQPLQVVRQFEVVSQNSKLIAHFQINYVLSNREALYELSETVRKLRLMRQSGSNLIGFAPFSMLRDGLFLQLVFHANSHTPMAWYKQGRLDMAQRCFHVTLKALKAVHCDYKLFYGSIGFDSIACTEEGKPILLNWAYSVQIEEVKYRTYCIKSAYWREHIYEHTGEAALDLTALLYSYADFLDHINKEEIPSSGIMTVLMESDDLEQWETFKSQYFLTGSYRLNQILKEYAECERIDYQQLYDTMDGYFRLNGDPSSSQMATDLSLMRKKWREDGASEEREHELKQLDLHIRRHSLGIRATFCQ